MVPPVFKFSKCFQIFGFSDVFNCSFMNGRLFFVCILSLCEQSVLEGFNVYHIRIKSP